MTKYRDSFREKPILMLLLLMLVCIEISTIQLALAKSGSQPLITLIDETESDFSPKLEEKLELAARSISRIVGATPREPVRTVLLNDRNFFHNTRAPSWSNALFDQGVIWLRIDRSTSGPELIRSFRHEFVHALVAQLSNGSSPVWLDEGLAQYLEGKNPSHSLHALDRAYSRNRRFKLSDSPKDFLALHPTDAPGLYAHSLQATASLISSFGMSKIRTFLELLSRDESIASAFKIAFGTSLDDFDKRIEREVRRKLDARTR